MTENPQVPTEQPQKLVETTPSKGQNAYLVPELTAEEEAFAQVYRDALQRTGSPSHADRDVRSSERRG